VFNRLGAQSLLAHEVENDARIQLPRSCSHGQTIERRESHRALHALARADGSKEMMAASAPNGHSAARQALLLDYSEATRRLTKPVSS
jgi:head-tail adaptor